MVPVRCRAGGGVSRRQAEELGQIVEETREASVQTDVQNCAEVRTDVRHKAEHSTLKAETIRETQRINLV